MRKSNWEVKNNGRGLTVNEIFDKIWISRGVKDVEEFLNPNAYHLYPATEFNNIDKAARTFIMMLKSNAKFLIYADVDTDGCASAAIMKHYLNNYGIDAEVYINEGKEHGVKAEFINTTLKEIEPEIVIVVDSINDTMEEYEKIWENGSQLIILDHHIPSKEILDNQASLNLITSAVDYPNPYLSGSGVTWKFVSYIDSLLGNNFAEDLVDLAATGIIADVCNVGPESMENRAICNLGFNRIVNVGIKTLIGSDSMDSTNIGFTIGPLINAANRMNFNSEALNLFITDNVTSAKNYIKILTKAKDKQKELVTEIYPKLEAQVIDQQDNRCYYFIMEDSNNNLSGLLATKLCAKYQRPCLVLYKRDTHYAGSMRAKGVEDFRKIVNDSGLAECNGHENSAGVNIPSDNFEQLKIYIEEQLSNITFKEIFKIDVTLNRSQITPYLLSKLKYANRIWGEGFSSINVLLEDISNYTIKKLSQGKHLCIETPDLKLLYWNFNDWDSLDDKGLLSVVGVLEESFFAGKYSNQLLISDYIFQPLS